MSSIQDRLLSVEDEFLDALLEGGLSLVVFEERWDKLLAEINLAFDSGSLDDGVSSLAHTTALRIATLAETSADLFARRDAITSELMDEIDTLMAHLTLSDESSAYSRSDVTPSLSWSKDNATHSLQSISPVSRKRRRDDDDGPRRSSGFKRQHISVPGAPANDVYEVTSPSTIPSTSTPSWLVSQTRSPSVDQLSQSRSRKRCRSDSDRYNDSCGLKRMYVGPRLHAVSDSFPTLQSTKHLESDMGIRQSDHGVGRSAIVDPSSSNASVIPPEQPKDQMSSLLLGNDSRLQAIGGEDDSPSMLQLDELDAFLKSLLEPGTIPIAMNLPGPPTLPTCGSPCSSPMSSSSLSSLSEDEDSALPSPPMFGLSLPSRGNLQDDACGYTFEQLHVESSHGVDVLSPYIASILGLDYNPASPWDGPKPSATSTTIDDVSPYAAYDTPGGVDLVAPISSCLSLTGFPSFDPDLSLMSSIVLSS
ncbi:hypothetical protein C8Q78DRAFT_1016559 [Trametes maxima]|nr:hypothetical protein C8Q78DRAFT_1016559 [Trametes maxima]